MFGQGLVQTSGKPQLELAGVALQIVRLPDGNALLQRRLQPGPLLMYQNKMGTEYEFFRMTGAEITSIERIWQEPLDLYWTRFVASDPQHKENAFSEETAREYIGAYKPITLVMKPFSEYPFG